MITTLCLLNLLIAAAPETAEPSAAQQPAPYQVTVCLRLSDNPMLTPLLADSLRRQVKDQLTSFFGPLADVEVLTEGHWLVDDYPGQPVEVPPVTPELLAEHKDASKVFLVCVDYKEGQYHVAWRNIDGKLGHVGPVHRKATPDRQWVAKAACLAAKDDFGLIALLKHAPVGGITIDLQGSQHSDRLEKLLGDEAIWQPFWVLKHPKGGTVRRPVPFTVVRTVKGKLHEPQLVSNLSDAFPRRASIVGMEAVKLNTCEGRIRLRLIDPATKSPVINCSVSANDEGFDELDDSDLLERPDRFGYVVSRKSFKNLAYVKVSPGGSSVIRFPLPITDALCDFEVEVPLDMKATEKNDFQRRLRSVTQDLHLIGAFQGDIVKEFNELNDAKRYEEALKRIVASLDSIRPALDTASGTLGRLKEEAPEVDRGAVAAITSLSGLLEQTKARNVELEQLRKSIELAISTRDAQNRSNVLIELARQAERDADFDLAIEKYELALGEQPNQPMLKSHLDKLKQIWGQKSAARSFVYEKWATAELTSIETLLPQAEREFEALKALGDYLTVQKLLAANSEHASQIATFVETLSNSEEQADKTEAEKYSKLADRVVAFQNKVAEYLDQAVAASAPSPTPPAPAETPAASESPPPGTDDTPPSLPPAGDAEEEPFSDKK